MIATSDCELETLTLKMVGTVSILQVISVRPQRGERIRDAVRRANVKVCNYNCRRYNEQGIDPTQKVLARFMDSATHPGNKILKRSHLRGQG